jgi:hypothetical protein
LSSRIEISLRKQIVFTLVAVVLAWFCVELLMLIQLWWLPWENRSDCPYMYGSHPYRAFAPIPNTVDRAGRRSFNSFGLRGAEIVLEKPADTIRIVCLGGSTTFSDGASTDSATYPARMERMLRDHYRGSPFRVEVINAGVNCYNSFESLIYFQTRLLDFSPDIAIFHHAINDVWFMLAAPGFQSDFSHARRTFALPPRKWWEYSPFLSCWFAKNTIHNPYYPARVVNLNVLIVTNPAIVEDPDRGRKGGLEPDMIATFERNTRVFLSIARGNRIVPVLSTQSIRDDPTDRGRWTQAIKRLNKATRDIAKGESVGLIDFAQLMPWNPVDYYDFCHLRDTPGGLGRKARIFADGLIALHAVEQAIAKQTGRSSQH